MRETGKIKFFGNKHKNFPFGFITRNNGEEIYVNRDSFAYTDLELASRLQIDHETINLKKQDDDFSKWSSQHDCNSLEWIYNPETQNFYPLFCKENQLVAFDTRLNPKKAKEEAIFVRLIESREEIKESKSPTQQNLIDLLSTTEDDKPNQEYTKTTEI